MGSEKENQKSFWDMGPAGQEEFFGEAVRRAVAALHAAGLPSVQLDDKGLIYRSYPDGHREYKNGDGE